MNKLSILFLLDKTRLNKNNKVPLRCRITYLSKRKIFSTGLFINPKNWNSSRQKVIPDNVENNQINTQLSLIKQEINQAFLYLKVQEKSFDVEDIFKQYKGETISKDYGLLEFLVRKYPFFGGDLSAYILYCAITNQFINCKLKDIYNVTTQIIQNYNAEQHLLEMKQFVDYELSEQEFAQLLGRARLYQHLPKSEKLGIPALHFNDSQLNTMAKDYYEDPYFSRENEGSINLWKVYNLFTQANKSSYIDTFLDRNLNAFEFSKSIQHSLSDNTYHWFLR